MAIASVDILKAGLNTVHYLREQTDNRYKTVQEARFVAFISAKSIHTSYAHALPR